MRALITGAHGFLGRNLATRLTERGDTFIQYGRDSDVGEIAEACATVDVIFHLAGANRPARAEEFTEVNRDLTRAVCAAAAATGRSIPIVFSSSTQVDRDSAYGVSKREAEQVLVDYARRSGAPVHIVRLPNVFGKWSRPNYNSAVATFCHNVARRQPIAIHDPAAALTLVYVDDVVDHFVRLATGDAPAAGEYSQVVPQYHATVGELAAQIRQFHDDRARLHVGPVGVGLPRALYATYLSFLPSDEFSYPITRHSDARGGFVEMLKTPDAGQFSFFTAAPGVTRGGHYHHTKCEKFLVIQGQARMRFRHIVTGEIQSVDLVGTSARIVDTIPGWAHDITNTGEEELIVMLWANEVFDRARPDTIACQP